jgi:hypothetical protein
MHDTTSMSWLVKGQEVHMFTAEGDLAVLSTAYIIYILKQGKKYICLYF